MKIASESEHLILVLELLTGLFGAGEVLLHPPHLTLVVLILGGAQVLEYFKTFKDQ